MSYEDNNLENNNPDEALKYAGFWVRSWALGIDQLIILGMLILVLVIAAIFVPPTKELGEKFSTLVMNFLQEKVNGLQDMPMSTPDQMQDSLSVVLSKLDRSLAYVLLPIQVVFSAIYFAIPESSRMQGSIGKYLMKIKIVDLNGERISFFRALCRNLMKIVPGYFHFLFSIIVFLPILFDKRKQGIHDMACKTLVVYKQQENL